MTITVTTMDMFWPAPPLQEVGLTVRGLRLVKAGYLRVTLTGPEDFHVAGKGIGEEAGLTQDDRNRSRGGGAHSAAKRLGAATHYREEMRTAR